MNKIYSNFSKDLFVIEDNLIDIMSIATDIFLNGDIILNFNPVIKKLKQINDELFNIFTKFLQEPQHSDVNFSNALLHINDFLRYITQHIKLFDNKIDSNIKSITDIYNKYIKK